MKPAEPIKTIHMPNGSILPLFISIGLISVGFGLIMIGMENPIVSPWIIVAVGAVITFGSMMFVL